jgi:hypothetical protein
MQKAGVCLECGGPLTAQRSTRMYCSEACKQRAKRKRQREKAELCSPARPALDLCDWCRGPLDRYFAVRRRRVSGPRYCSDECKRRARRVREGLARDAKRREAEESRYRAAPTREAGDDFNRVKQAGAYGVTQPEFAWSRYSVGLAPYSVVQAGSYEVSPLDVLPCGHTDEWHRVAERLLSLVAQGRVELAEPDDTLSPAAENDPDRHDGDPPSAEISGQWDGPEPGVTWEEWERHPESRLAKDDEAADPERDSSSFDDLQRFGEEAPWS